MNAVEVFEDWLDGYLNFERTPKKDIFWLDTIDYLCKRFDNPQDCAPCFHVAGSKGKGSVSRMISCILEQAGYSVGIYSSPHILDFRERISKPNSFFDEAIYEETVRELVPKIESIIPEALPAKRPLTWFEIVTMYAFLCFRRAKVDWAVYEVGLGGRRDATNVIRPKICCITPIELEHTEFLGNTLEQIAGEKAGIIKNCTPVIIAPQQNESINEVLIQKAERRHAPYYFVENLINSLSYSFNKSAKKKNRMHFELDCSIFSRPLQADLQLMGGMQAYNATMAAIAVRKIFPNLPEETIEKGLENAWLPGRFEIKDNLSNFKDIPFVILDGAHTLNSIKLTIQTINQLYSNEHFNLLFACAADKDIKDIAKLFVNRFDNVYVTRPGSQKHSDLKLAIESFTQAGINFKADKNYFKIIVEALETSAKENKPLLVIGSFYLVAEVKNILSL